MTKAMTPSEISGQLQITIRAVYLLIAQQRMKAFRVGRKLRVLEEDFEEFIKEQCQRGT